MAEKVMVGLSHLFVTAFLYNFSLFMVVPAITDVTMEALCPGKDECSLAIYLTGLQQALIGMGTLVMMPLIGNLSDAYGRKVMLTFPMMLTTLPLVILAYDRSKYFFYAYYVLKTLTSMICEGSVLCLALAYVADNIPEQRRASSFGILTGITSCSFVFGNLSTRFISTSTVFQVSAAVSMTSVVYMRIFLPESNIELAVMSTPKDAAAAAAATEPLLEKCSTKTTEFRRAAPSLTDSISLLRSSWTFSQAAIVAFFSSVAELGMISSLLYYLKAQFHFDKTQFADLMIINGVAGAVSQMILMPMLAPMIREEKLLSIGLIFGCVHLFLYGVAWTSWVPYLAAMFSVLSVFAGPCLRTIASKQVGPSEQGKAQGCIMGICSFAGILSPLAFSPLTALFLSENAPFRCPGFSLLCAGFAMMIAFIQSIMIRSPSPVVLSCTVDDSDSLEP